MSGWEVNDAVVKQNEGMDVVDVIPGKLSRLIPSLAAKIPLLCTLRADYYSYLMYLTHLMLLDSAYAGNQRMEVFSLQFFLQKKGFCF